MELGTRFANRLTISLDLVSVPLTRLVVNGGTVPERVKPSTAPVNVHVIPMWQGLKVKRYHRNEDAKVRGGHLNSSMPTTGFQRQQELIRYESFQS